MVHGWVPRMGSQSFLYYSSPANANRLMEPPLTPGPRGVRAAAPIPGAQTTLDYYAHDIATFVYHRKRSFSFSYIWVAYLRERGSGILSSFSGRESLGHQQTPPELL